MIETLQYIKTKKIAHRDIKIENMLVNESFQLKFADFGFASLSKEVEKQQMGTPIYVAPEIIQGKEYLGEKVDVFSCGVVLFIMLTGRYPFYCATLDDKRYKLLIEGKSAEYWKTFDGKISISPECCELLEKMFAYEPSSRYSLEEICAHPWYQMIKENNQAQIEDMSQSQREAKPTRAGVQPSPN
jgi:serine/threonine protein kinase